VRAEFSGRRRRQAVEPRDSLAGFPLGHEELDHQPAEPPIRSQEFAFLSQGQLELPVDVGGAPPVGAELSARLFDRLLDPVDDERPEPVKRQLQGEGGKGRNGHRPTSSGARAR